MRKTFLTATVALMLLATAAFAGGGFGAACDGARGDRPGHKAQWNCDMGPGHGMGNRMGPGMRGHPGMGGGLLKWADKLELTDKQQEQFKKMQHAFQMEKIDREAELKKAAVTLKMLMHDDGAADSDVMKAIDDAARLRADMKKKQYLHHKEMMGILTSEQIEKMKELRLGSNVQPDRDAKGRRGFGR